ncbi:coproporphyrinogen III oxidase [Vibrio tubiashii]|nr:coproporphyrinogen III oxidase [Vibrio tubiashii]
MNVTLLAIAGGVIILGLASYAGYLLLQVKKQKELQLQHQKLAIEKRNANIFESVSTLCLAGIQEQCDLSEISIRLYNIMDYVQGEERVDFDQEFPATSELFHIVKDMARGEERQNLPKQERMKQNLARHKAESRLQESIVEELKKLQKKVQPLNNQINIQMV